SVDFDVAQFRDQVGIGRTGLLAEGRPGGDLQVAALLGEEEVHRGAGEQVELDEEHASDDALELELGPQPLVDEGGEARRLRRVDHAAQLGDQVLVDLDEDGNAQLGKGHGREREHDLRDVSQLPAAKL